MGIMAALSSVKWVVIGAIFAAVMSTIGVLYWQNSTLRTDNAILTENQSKLLAAIEVQKETIVAHQAAIAEWKESAAQMQRNLSAMGRMQRDAAAQLRRLEDVYEQHDLRALSLRKPKLVERRINDGTAAIIDSLRDATN